MTGRERVLAVIKREQPDRVPTFEWAINADVIKAITGDMSFDDFVEIANLDAVMCKPIYLKKPIENNMLVDEWGVTRMICQDDYAMAMDKFSPIRDWADLEKWEPPDPYALHRFELMKQQIERFKGNKAIFVQIRDVFSNPRDLMGYEKMLINCIQNPDLVNALLEKCVDHSIKLVQISAELGAEIVITGDDIADNKSTLISPKMFETLFIPHFRRLIQAIHDCGLYIWKHTDGNIMNVMDMLIDAGIDGIDPIDPLAKMDLSTVKRHWGNRVAIKGNVDCVKLLTDGIEDDVIEAVKECIRVAGPGGGYVCSSSNTIHSGVKPELYQSMLKSINEYGKYPLDMDKLAPSKKAKKVR